MRQDRSGGTTTRYDSPPTRHTATDRRRAPRPAGRRTGSAPPRSPRRRRSRGRISLAVGVVALLVAAGTVLSAAELLGGRAYLERDAHRSSRWARRIPTQPLDGTGNNQRHPEWGAADTIYARVGPPSYADGLDEPVPGPNSRYISNRIFNDTHANVFSERNVTSGC